MPTTDCVADITPPASKSEDSPIDAPPQASSGTSRLLKGLLFGFAATVTIGLALGIWYLGVRIVASHPAGELYLQIAGFGSDQDSSFARSLQAEGFHAQVNLGAGGHARILIGPFSTHAETEQAQRKLRSAGLLAVETPN